MRQLLRMILVLATMLSAAGCAVPVRAGEPPAADRGATSATLQFRGEIVHLSFEGGFWGIVAEDGSRYDPGRLPPEFQQAGLKVLVTAKLVRERVSFRMWGKPIELVKIERR